MRQQGKGGTPAGAAGGTCEVVLLLRPNAPGLAEPLLGERYPRQGVPHHGPGDEGPSGRLYRTGPLHNRTAEPPATLLPGAGPTRLQDGGGVEAALCPAQEYREEDPAAGLASLGFCTGEPERAAWGGLLPHVEDRRLPRPGMTESAPPQAARTSP